MVFFGFYFHNNEWFNGALSMEQAPLGIACKELSPIIQLLAYYGDLNGSNSVCNSNVITRCSSRASNGFISRRNYDATDSITVFWRQLVLTLQSRLCTFQGNKTKSPTPYLVYSSLLQRHYYLQLYAVATFTGPIHSQPLQSTLNFKNNVLY